MTTIYRVIKRYEKHGLTTRCRGKDKKEYTNKIRTKRWLAGQKRSIKSDPSVNQSVHARKRGVCEKTVSRACKTHHNSIESLKRDIVKAFKH